MEIRRSRKKTLIVIALLFVLALVVSGGALGYAWYHKAEQDKRQPESSSSGAAINLDTAPKIETETLQAALVISASTDKPGDTIKVSVLSITVPKAWRAVNAKNLLNTPLESVYADSTNDILAQFVMVPEQNPADPTLATNGLSFYNITAWLKKTSAGTTGQVTPAMKSAYITNISNLGDGKPTDKAVCSKSVGILNVTVCGDLLKPVAITTKDGSLKGAAFLAAATQSVSYDPQVFVFLTGRVKDQQIMAYGNFHLLDQNSHQLSTSDTAAVKAARDSFTKGVVPADTQQLYQHVIDAVKSISIQAN